MSIYSRVFPNVINTSKLKLNNKLWRDKFHVEILDNIHEA